MQQQPVRYFLSYAHADGADVKRFNEVLLPQLATAANYHFQPWIDTGILPGENWKNEIETALNDCHFGILLVSPNFLSSKFIIETELKPLLAKSIVVPVALHPILFDGTMNLKGLAPLQLYRDPQGRSFDACTQNRIRRAFALDLYRKITALLQKKAAA